MPLIFYRKSTMVYRFDIPGYVVLIYPGPD